MSVIRVHKTKNYTVMSNTHLRDKDLSLKAKGLLSVMLSLPDDWSYSISGLCAICKESETAIKSALDELKANGYVAVNREEPSKQNGGRIRYSYDVFEEPKKEIQEGKIQGVENLGVEFQGVESVPLLNTNKANTYKKHNSSAAQNECDFSLEIIAKAKEITDDKCILGAISYYLGKYKHELGKKHPDISYQVLIRFVKLVTELLQDSMEDIRNENGFIRMIDRHFKTNYGLDIDYNFPHFATEGIIEYQARNCGYIEGYKD